MCDNSEDEVFFDAIGDQAQIEAIKEQNKSEEIKRETIILQENISSRANVKVPMPDIHKLQASRLDKSEDTTAQQSLESTGILKSFDPNSRQVRSAMSSKKKFFALLGKKQTVESEYSRENIKLHNKMHSDFENLICLQNLQSENKQNLTTTSKKSKDSSSTWVSKFSPNIKLLATGSSDGVLKIFRVTLMDETPHKDEQKEVNFQVLDPDYISLTGHKSDIIDITWYKDSKLILTSSLDKTVILWDVESKRLVKIFEHPDIVSCIAFHPLIDGFFASGCFDKMIRIWDLNETKVVDFIQANDLITALTFSPDKCYLLVGFYKGTVKIYRIDQGKLKFMTEVICKNNFKWGKVNKVGKKVTGITFTEDCEFLVMTNDSRMRLIDFKTFETKAKYKGHVSGKYHIQPSYNFEKEMIICGSEDGKVYIWNKYSNYVPQVNPRYTGNKKNRNTSYENFKPFDKSHTTCAIWLPFEALKTYKEKVLSQWKDIYVDNLMVLFSSDSKVKILGNLIELENTPIERSASGNSVQ